MIYMRYTRTIPVIYLRWCWDWVPSDRVPSGLSAKWPSAKWPSAKWTECQVDGVPSVTECQVDWVPSMTECQVDRVQCMTECQVNWVPSMTKCQCDRVPSMPSPKLLSAKCDRVPSVTKCQVSECQVWYWAKTKSKSWTRCSFLPASNQLECNQLYLANKIFSTCFVNLNLNQLDLIY